MSGSEKLTTLDAVQAEIARLETYSLQLIADLEKCQHAKDIGAGNTGRLLSLRYCIDPAEAHRKVHLAVALAKYPLISAALPDPADLSDPAEDGRDDDGADYGADDAANDDGATDNSPANRPPLIHPGQAAAIITALEDVPKTVPVEDLRAAEQQLVNLARTFCPADLRKAAKRIRDILDTDGPEPAEKKAYGRESLTLANADHGVKFHGYLANENAELFRALIHAGAKPHKTVDGELDPRPRTKRQADALTSALTVATNAQGTTADPTPGAATATTDPAENSDVRATDDTQPASGATKPEFIPGHGPKAQITVTIDFNDLKAATADKIGELVYGDGLSAGAIRRLACDAKVIPVVLGSKSQLLDVGTTVRLVTGPMRQALNVRDKGCVACGAKPIHCEAHHIVSWIDGGATKVTNLVLLCKRCHIDLHNGHWTIQIIDGIVHVARPAWGTPDPAPPHRHRQLPTPPTGSAPAAPGSATRAWTRDTDPPWITPAEAARLNPWGEPPAAPTTPTPGDDRDKAARPDPWGEPPAAPTTPTPPRKAEDEAAHLDPWGDAPATPPSSRTTAVEFLST